MLSETTATADVETPEDAAERPAEPVKTAKDIAPELLKLLLGHANDKDEYNITQDSDSGVILVYNDTWATIEWVITTLN